MPRRSRGELDASPDPSPMRRLVPFLLLLAAPASAQALVVSDSLTAASDTLTSGEYKHVVEVPVETGQRLTLTLAADAFDPYLIVRSPTGAQRENDDCTPGDRHTACLDWTADTTATVRVIATSYAPGETGAFRLAVRASEPGLGAREVRCPSLPTAPGLAGEVTYLLRFAPDGRLLGSEARTSAPALQIAADRIVAGCRADPLPPDAPQVPQATLHVFRAGS